MLKGKITPAQFRLLICLIGIFLINSCTKEVNNDVVVYNNDFESGNLSNISNGTITVFNGNHVLGRYNNGNFVLKLDTLPKHNLLQITFDLYIHDTWDGNANYANDIAGPDIWQMSVDGQNYVYTTFSNQPCISGNTCPSQSYPGNYPSNNNPRTGAYENLPGACAWAPQPDGTSHYKIIKRIDHHNGVVTIQCLDQLIDKLEADPKCSESWSVDNLKVEAISL